MSVRNSRMMKLYGLFFLAWLVLLTGCSGPVETTAPTEAATVELAADPTPSSTAVKTLAPAETQTSSAATDYPAMPEGMEATAYPVQPVEGGPTYPYPYPEPRGAVEIDPGVPFNDCARTPGLVGCDPVALPISARLAVVDRDAGRLIVIDLANGTGWQAPGQPGGLDWAAGGGKLLAWRSSEGGRESVVWSASGEVLENPGTDQVLRWQPGGDLTPLNRLTYPGGTRYRLELVDGSHWDLLVRAPDRQQITLTIDPAPADRQYLLVDSFSGGDLLLQSYFPTNLGLASGGELLRVNPQAGTITPLGVSAPILEEARFAVSPVSPDGLLAFSASGSEPGLTRLALFDPGGQKVEFPFPEGIQSAMQDWHPQAELLLVTAAPLLPGQDQEDFPGAGIYQFDPQSGAVTRLVATPPGAQDGAARWSSDGKVLVYGRLITSPQGNALAEVRALFIETEREVVLFKAISAPPGPGGAAQWSAIMAVGK